MDGQRMEGRRIVVEQAGAPTRRRRSPKKEDTCFECGGSGHW